MVMSRRANMPNAENCTLAELDTAAQAAPSKRSHVRMIAIKALLLGISHDQVAAIYSISRRTLSRWINRFNDRGIDGLIERSRSGRPSKISPEQSIVYRELIKHPERTNQLHWTAKKFHGYLTKHLEEEIGYRTVIRWLHKENFCLKVPRSWPDRQDEEKRKAFIQQVQTYLKDPDIEIWYLDETGIEGDPRPRRRWAQKGEKIKHPYQGSHLRMNATGMICPRTGEFYALEFSHSDTEVFQTFLDHANRDVHLERPRNLIICDNATWHKAKSIKWGRFESVFLPPYSPDLNPIERLWLLMKAEWFSGFIAKSMNDLVNRLDQALNWVIGRKANNRITCAIQTKF